MEPAKILDPSYIECLSDILSNSRPWHNREQCKYPLHPAVLAAFEIDSPIDWQSVILAWPHRSPVDHSRLGYTQDERKGEADRQTVTSIGKYLAKNWNLPDHTVRAIAARFTASGVEIHRTTEMIVKAVQEGPKSCMQWSAGYIAGCAGHHAYECYAPEFGWGIAIRVEDGKIIGRALILDADGEKCFVRTYKHAAGDGYSQRDEGMEQYLIGQGYRHAREWPEGARMAGIEGHHGHLVFPYMDGDAQRVRVTGDCLIVDSDGEYECDHTDGNASVNNENMSECDNCGDNYDSENEGSSVGYEGDTYVCDHCATHRFSMVTGRRGNQYLIRDTDAVEVDGESYDPDYLGDNDIVELDNGDYSHIDNATRCEVDGCWYSVDDCRSVEDKDGGMVHESNTWQCYGSDDWYSTDTDSVEYDGETYHPDNVPDPEDDTPEYMDNSKTDHSEQMVLIA